mmetsp:Transcript_46910/g.135145  ORF Transcript_46910/g.135145 Transcript_46910/m.135145 type:complete len:326 (+) Transcript_46910:3-980(+)
MTGREILMARCDELAEEAAQGSGVRVASKLDDAGENAETRSIRRCVPTALLVFSLLPWHYERYPCSSRVCRWLMRTLVAVSASVYIFLHIGCGVAKICVPGMAVCQHVGLSKMPLAIGSILALALVSMGRQTEFLEDTFALVHVVSLEREYQDLLARLAFRDNCFFASTFLCILVASGSWEHLVAESESCHVEARIVVEGSIVTLSGGTILSLAHGMGRVCRSLSVMLDSFSLDTVNMESPHRIAHSWNVTQAVIRKAAFLVEHYLVVLCFVELLTVPLLLIDSGFFGTHQAPMTTMLPGFFVSLAILYVFLLAAKISEQCRSRH